MVIRQPIPQLTPLLWNRRRTETDEGTLRVTVRTIIATTLVASLLTACGEKDVILPGERLDIRDGMAGQSVGTTNGSMPIGLPAAQANADWTHRNGGPDHHISHPALSGALRQVFSVNIGEGDSRRARITADPVVAGGRVCTLDARSNVQATSTGGAVLWTQDVTPASDAQTDASGGGIATNGSVVFVTTGFGRLSALDAATGGVLWTQELNAPGGSALRWSWTRSIAMWPCGGGSWRRGERRF